MDGAALVAGVRLDQLIVMYVSVFSFVYYGRPNGFVSLFLVDIF